MENLLMFRYNDADKTLRANGLVENVICALCWNKMVDLHFKEIFTCHSIEGWKWVSFWEFLELEMVVCHLGFAENFPDIPLDRPKTTARGPSKSFPRISDLNWKIQAENHLRSQ